MATKPKTTSDVKRARKAAQKRSTKRPVRRGSLAAQAERLVDEAQQVASSVARQARKSGAGMARSAKASMDDALSAASDEIHDRGAAALAGARTTARRVGRKVAEKGAEASAAATDTLEKSISGLDDVVRARPIESLGTALLAGLILGLLIRK